jgi:hypothetical protein
MRSIQKASRPPDSHGQIEKQGLCKPGCSNAAERSKHEGSPVLHAGRKQVHERPGGKTSTECRKQESNCLTHHVTSVLGIPA